MKDYTKLFYLLLIVLPINIIAQLDTTKWYPLETGNNWEYHDPSYGDLFRYRVGNDTLLANGQTYKIIWASRNQSKNWSIGGFERIEDGKYYRYVQDPEACDNKEDLLYDFNVPDSSIWIQCNQFFAMGENEINFNGLIRTYERYDYTANLYLPAKEFTTVIVDTSTTPPDTIWNPLLGYGWITITKGIGTTKILAEQTHWELHGAYIDGELYGEILVGVENEQEEHIPREFEISLYPNPTNSIANIIIKGETGKQVDLSLYNMLGEKIETVYKGYLRNSKERFLWNSENAVSGIYIVVLRSADLTVANKITVIK